EQTDKPSLMNKIDPTYVSKKLWDKQILQTPGATEAVEKAANNDECWKTMIPETVFCEFPVNTVRNHGISGRNPPEKASDPTQELDHQ
ncbi:unnamed protein product, partial [Adineta steineri]